MPRSRAPSKSGAPAAAAAAPRPRPPQRPPKSPATKRHRRSPAPALRCRCGFERSTFVDAQARVETLVTTDPYVTSVRAVPPPLPSLLFSAVAATVVMLPWAFDGVPGDRDRATMATAPLIVERPLAGIGGGETVRDVHQDTPFSMVALTAADLTGTTARVRAKQARRLLGSLVRGRSPRRRRRRIRPHGPVAGTEPVFVGRTTDRRRSSVHQARRRRQPAHRRRRTRGRPGRSRRPRLRARQRRAAVRARTSTPC